MESNNEATQLYVLAANIRATAWGWKGLSRIAL
jgi:hypothetical protein